MVTYPWVSEAVSRGHPDKTADQLADAVLDAHLEQDPLSRVACEITCKKTVHVTGEITSEAKVNIPDVIRKKLDEIGYDRDEHGFNCHTVPINMEIDVQSPQIAKAVTQADGQIGAGDQGHMFGFACTETPEYMPLPHQLAFEFINVLRADIESQRRDGKWGSPLLPDAKTQVTVEYEEFDSYMGWREVIPKHVRTVIISTQHRSAFTLEQIRTYVRGIAQLVVDKYNRDGNALFDDKTEWIINKAGAWTIGGPGADTGLSGRKIVVDNYGPDCPIGGGSFSGKDPTKVDRSGAYAARWIAKNLVAAGFCSRMTVQVSYVIGRAEPVSIRVQPGGKVEPAFIGLVENPEQLAKIVNKVVDLTPKGIIDALNLRTRKGFRYQDTAHGGHFGRKGFPWEELNLVDKFKSSL